MSQMIKITTLTLFAATALATMSVRADEPEKKSSPVQAEVDASLPMDGRIRELEYNRNDIYTMLTRVGYQSHIQFGVREEVDTISVGDRSFWQIIPAGNRLFIRPMADDVATNMTVITNKRSYQFDLQSTSDPEKKIIYVARFTYPDDIKEKPVPTYDPFLLPQTPPAPAPVAPVTTQLLPPPPAVAAVPAPAPHSLATPYPAPYVAPRPVVEPLPAQSEYVPPPAPVPTPSAVAEVRAPQPVELKPLSDQELAQLPSPLLETLPAPAPSFVPASAPQTVAVNSVRNLQYTFAGPSEAAPYEVFDDGVTTHLLYQNPPASLPLISVMDENNQERPVTVYQKDGYIAVDTVAPRLVVRTEGATVYVFNELMSVKQ